MSGIEKLLNLLDKDIPQCKKRLQDSHVNLEDVATYCEGNYANAMDKRQALEETKNYMTQSLASVAYQINLMSVSFLQLLDLEVEQVSEMEAAIGHLSQVISIHKEKVARREIGELTNNKSYFRPPGTKSNGVVLPEKPEQSIAYVRKPIDFNALDCVGISKKAPNKHDRATYAEKNRGSNISESCSTSSQLKSGGGPGQDIDVRPMESVQTADVFASLPAQPFTSPRQSFLPPPLPDENEAFPTVQLRASQAGGAAVDDVAEPFVSRLSRMILDEASWIPEDFIEKVVAVYSYSQDKGDELSFDEGAIIYVTEKNEDGWWEGVMNGQTGLFPSNYVEPCI